MKSFKYRRLPVIQEAIRYTPEGWDPENSEFDCPEWLRASWELGKTSPDSQNALFSSNGHTGDTTLTINTWGGSVKVYPNDFIVRGIDGVLYPCVSHVFLKIYEKIDWEL